MVMPRTSFFTASAPVNKTHKTERSIIAVGGEQFHAVAVALIDNLKSGAQLTDPALKSILECFFSAFPEYKTNHSYLRPVERMGMLINNRRISEMVSCMAYVLRQLTVDELYAHPLAYRSVFNTLSRNTSEAYLRQNSTVLPYVALAALATTLDIGIELSFVESGKELRQCRTFSLNATPSFVAALQVQGSSYFPRVKNKADFNYVGQLTSTAPKPVESASSVTIASILDSIVQDNQALLRSREHYLKALIGMELTAERVLALYIEFLPDDESDREFWALVEGQSVTPVVSSIIIGDAEQQARQSRMKAIAGWLSRGQVNADVLFDAAEERSSAALVSL